MNQSPCAVYLLSCYTVTYAVRLVIECRRFSADGSRSATIDELNRSFVTSADWKDEASLHSLKVPQPCFRTSDDMINQKACLGLYTADFLLHVDAA
jgi:hypothetical protein